MNKVYRIGLVYINTNNLGDIVIFDTAKYLINKSLKGYVSDYQIYPIDMGEKEANKCLVPDSYVESQKNKYSSKDKYTREWKMSKLFYYFQNNEVPVLKTMDLIIFAGGGLIKFHEQFFHMYIDEVTRVAEENNIPVIFNAVGVEGYKENDIRCQILKKALNRSCVKAISTRDNIKLLREKYLTNKALKIVCDPALWSPETYNLNMVKRDKVGIGVIRPEIFPLYGGNMPKDNLIKYFSGLVQELEKRGVKYELFSNGGKRDQNFIEDVRSYLDRDKEVFMKNVASIPKSGAELASMINRYSKILSCRMHGAVIAYSLGVPAISLVWNDKQKYFANLTKQPYNLIESKGLTNISKSVDKILACKAPTIDNNYKNSDYEFIKKYVWRYYWRRYFVKFYRYTQEKKRQFTNKIGKK